MKTLRTIAGVHLQHIVRKKKHTEEIKSNVSAARGKILSKNWPIKAEKKSMEDGKNKKEE